MGARVRHRLAPVVVEEDVGERVSSQYVRICFDGADVVVHKVPREAIDIDKHSGQPHCHVEPGGRRGGLLALIPPPRGPSTPPGKTVAG